MKTQILVMCGATLALLFVACEGGTKSVESGAAVLTGDEEKGRQLFIKNGCVSCHGDRGMGDGPVGQALSPRPRNFRLVNEYLQGSSADEIAKTIQTGIPGTMMVAYPLSAEDRMLIARFIVHLQKN